MKFVKALVWIATILLLLVIPLVGDSIVVSIAVSVLLLTGATAAWNIFSGYTGYISLGNATYFGIGAYALAIACQDWHIPGGWGPFFLVPLAGLVCGSFAVPVGWIALRVKRYTFLVMTIAIFFLFQSLSYNLQGITGGSTGIFLPLPDWGADAYYLPFYYVAGAMLLLVTVLAWRIRSSKFGLKLLAIRDDEDRASGLGIDTRRYKIEVYTLSASFFGMIGAIAAYMQGNVTPSVAFDPTLNLTVVVACFFGGIGTIVGGVLLVSIQTILIQQFGGSMTGLDQVLLGGFLLAIILLFPEGIVPTFVRLWDVLHFDQRIRSARQTALSSSVDFIEMNGSKVRDTRELHSFVGQSTKVHTQNPPIIFMKPHLVGYHSDNTFQRAKAQRLKPLTAEMTTSEVAQLKTIPIGSWRCPECRKPFTLRSGMCYCPRCDLSRPLEEQKP